MGDDSVPLADFMKKCVNVGGQILAGLWILVGTVFFLVRISMAIYGENAGAIHNLLDQAPWR